MRAIIYASSLCLVGLAGPVWAGGNGHGHCCSQVCRSHREHHSHHQLHHWLEPPPQGAIVGSMAAPLMSATPALPLSGLRSLTTSESELPPEMLRALAGLIEEKSGARQAAPAQRSPAQRSMRSPKSSAANSSPAANSAANSAAHAAATNRNDEEVAALEARMAGMEQRMMKLQERTDEVLDQLQKVLNDLDD